MTRLLPWLLAAMMMAGVLSLAADPKAMTDCLARHSRDVCAYELR